MYDACTVFFEYFRDDVMLLKNICAVSMCCLVLSCFGMRAEAAGQPGFTVQVETLSFEPAARAVVNRLRERGYDAFFESSSSDGGRVLYRVRFGRFLTRAEADAAAQTYKRQEQRECFVVRTMLPTVASNPTREILSGAAADAPRVQAQPEPASGSMPVDGNDLEFYTLQIAAKSDKSVAQSLSDRLSRKGYPVYVLEPDPADTKPFYRVRIGRYENRAQAEQAGRSYAEHEGGEFLVVLSPPGRLEGFADAGVGPSASPEAKEYVFTVQLCVRETRESAERYAARVRAQGFEPYIMRYDAPNGKILYRVRMGDFRERAQAEELVRTYTLQGGSDYLIVRTEQERSSALMAPPVVPVAADQQTPAKSEPEALPELMPQADRPEQKPAPTGKNPAIQGPDVPAASPADWPETVSRVYAYAGPDNELNLTNASAGIPRDMVGRIQYVSLFPVRFVTVSDDARFFVLEVEGAQRRFRPAGIRLPAQARDYVVSAIQQMLSDEPLRLRHSPVDGADVLIGSLYYRSGADVQVALIKRGFALVDDESVPVGRLNEFHAALKRARELQVGIWAVEEN
jgi:cell division septation protein DedD/endonuclease YncB( thermonuclease family)